MASTPRTTQFFLAGLDFYNDVIIFVVHIQTVLFGNAKGFMHYAGIHFFYSLVATKILNRQLFLYGNVTLRCALSIHLTDEPIKRHRIFPYVPENEYF
jgi:hypothetical protein